MSYPSLEACLLDLEKAGHLIRIKEEVDPNLEKTIIINKGTQSGIKKGMPVTQNNYLVGRIVETNYLSSRVLLLNDLNTSERNGTLAS